jgi:HlyD family secretion protein
VVENGVARERIVTIGQRGARQAEVLEGLEEGDVIVTHPSDAVADGVMIVDRTTL